MNIEEIKKKVEKGHYIVCKESYHGTTWMDSEAEEDIEYLLSIIEQAEKDLKLIANGNNEFPTWGDTVDVLKDVRSVANEALKSIQGEGLNEQ